jgi:hypothetical protein
MRRSTEKKRLRGVVGPGEMRKRRVLGVRRLCELENVFLPIAC